MPMPLSLSISVHVYIHIHTYLSIHICIGIDIYTCIFNLVSLSLVVNVYVQAREPVLTPYTTYNCKIEACTRFDAAQLGKVGRRVEVLIFVGHACYAICFIDIERELSFFPRKDVAIHHEDSGRLLEHLHMSFPGF